jgi:hypothetical protein
MLMGTHGFEYAGDLVHVSGPGMVMEFDIAADTVIESGEIVALSAGKVVAVSDMTKPILGMAAEPHDGTTDDRQKGTKIKVYCSPTAVFKCRPNVKVVADSGSATTLVDATFGSIANDVFNGGYLKLKKTSTVTVKPIDGLLPITDFTTTTGTFSGVFTGGFAAGDEAVLLPPVGAYAFALDSDGTNLDFTTGAKTILKVVKVDAKTEEVYVSPRIHEFANVPVATA